MITVYFKVTGTAPYARDSHVTSIDLAAGELAAWLVSMLRAPNPCRVTIIAIDARGI